MVDVSNSISDGPRFIKHKRETCNMLNVFYLECDVFISDKMEYTLTCNYDAMSFHLDDEMDCSLLLSLLWELWGS